MWKATAVDILGNPTMAGYSFHLGGQLLARKAIHDTACTFACEFLDLHEPPPLCQ